MNELTKAARKAIRDAASIAYERELTEELNYVAETFEQWRAGKLNAFDVSNAIHEFHQGAARQLFKEYEAGGSSVSEIAVAAAVINGFLKIEEIAPAGRGHIAHLVEAITAAHSEAVLGIQKPAGRKRPSGREHR